MAVAASASAKPRTQPDGRFALTVADLADRRRWPPSGRHSPRVRARPTGPVGIRATPSKPTCRFVSVGRHLWNITSRTRALSGCDDDHMPMHGPRSGSAPLFEGAQGLLLDQDRGCFPHVTRSNTGLRNVLALADELGLERLDVTYVTRAYLTRHGAGAAAARATRKTYPGVVDTTNVPNEHQGTLRFAWLDLDLLGRAIAADLAMRIGCQRWRSILGWRSLVWIRSAVSA
jgi:hypothetical protein